MPPSILELVKEYWEAVGLKVLLKIKEFALYRERILSAQHDISAAPVDNCTEITAWGGGMTGQYYNHGWAAAWSVWLEANEEVRAGRKTLEDFKEGKLPGEEPPEEMKELYYINTRWRKTKFRSKEYMELAQKVYDFRAKNLFIIGTVGMSPTVYIAKKDIGNVPKAYNSILMTFPGSLNNYANQLFFKQ